jgi:hypothetical protein
MKVLADFHHAGLFNSLRLLIEKRLGGELYRPIGKEWLDSGYWLMGNLYNNHPATVAQYLGIQPNFDNDNNGIYYIDETAHFYKQKAITLERFFKEKFDIVIASIPQHIQSFYNLSQAHKDKPKTIYQIGNAWNVDYNVPIKNIMASALLTYKPAGFNIIEYHQEFELDIFKPDNNIPNNNIYAFFNCFNTHDIYKFDWEVFQNLETIMANWNFKSFGGSCRDGAMNGIKELANKMKEAKFIWHTKFGGDGYGHVIHNATAVGKPAIVRKSYYVNKLAEKLMIDGETCITIDGLGFKEIENKINYYSDGLRYHKLCMGAYSQFKKIVNFDKEAEILVNFVNKLL